MRTSIRPPISVPAGKPYSMRITALLAVLVLLGACAAPETLLLSTDSGTIAAASGFAIVAPPAGTIGAANSHESERLRAAVEDEITRTPRAKGYRLADPTVADLKIEYRLVPEGRVPREDRENTVAESRVSTGPGDPYGTYRPLAGTGAGERRGMLLLTITNVKSGATVWQATNEGVVAGTSSAVHAAVRGTRAALAKIPEARHRAP